MNFPRRISQHVAESSSIRILSSLFPKEWIIREITERDYGIDLYLEIIGTDGFLTGKLVALQVKSTQKKVKFRSDGRMTYGGIKKSSVNYWVGLPVPVFLILVDLESKQAYWASINCANRDGQFTKNKRPSIEIQKTNNFTSSGLTLFQLIYLRERRWRDVETCMEGALLSYSSLGPLVLICKRKDPNTYCSTAIQYQLIRHYENYSVLMRYLLSKKPRPLPEWYDEHIAESKLLAQEIPRTFSYGLIWRMIKYFISDYRCCIIAAHNLVMDYQKAYFQERFPYLHLHMCGRPQVFVGEDWFPRYYLDQYENETHSPELLFFSDFTVYDFMLDDLSKT